MAKPTDDEIEDVIQWATESTTNGASKFPGMTYEEGVDAALRWAKGETDERPDAE